VSGAYREFHHGGVVFVKFPNHSRNLIQSSNRNPNQAATVHVECLFVCHLVSLEQLVNHTDSVHVFFLKQSHAWATVYERAEYETLTFRADVEFFLSKNLRANPTEFDLMANGGYWQVVKLDDACHLIMYTIVFASSGFLRNRGKGTIDRGCVANARSMDTP